jgi:hypothetical protein
MNDAEKESRGLSTNERRYQPPPLVKKRRMKRSCSEWELLVLVVSTETSGFEG